MKKIYAKAEPHHNQARGGFAYRLKSYTPCASRDRRSQVKINACVPVRKLGSSVRLQKNRHPILPRRAFYTRMKKRNGQFRVKATCHGLCIGCDGTDGTLL